MFPALLQLFNSSSVSSTNTTQGASSVDNFSKLVSMIILGLMAVAGLFIIVYDLCIIQTTNFPTVAGYLLGVPVIWAMGTLGIHTGLSAMQTALGSAAPTAPTAPTVPAAMSSTSPAPTTQSTTATPATTPVTSPASSATIGTVTPTV